MRNRRSATASRTADDPIISDRLSGYVGRDKRRLEVHIGFSGRMIGEGSRFFPGVSLRAAFQWRGKADFGPGPDPRWLSRRIPMSRQALTRAFVALGIAVGCASLTWAQAARAAEDRLGRGDHRVPARQRPAGAAIPRPVPTQGHGQPDGLRRLAARGVRRNRAWRTCSSTCSSRGRPTIPTSPRSSRSAGPSSTARPGSTGPTTTRRSTPPTTTSSSPSSSRPTGWSTASSRARTSPPR